MLVVAYDNATGDGDLVRQEGHLLAGAGIETLVQNSLCLDAPAHPGDPVPDDIARSGYWADALDGEVTGSRLWILQYMAANEAARLFAIDAAAEALAWMMRAPYFLAKSVEVSARYTPGGTIAVYPSITKPSELAPSVVGVWDFEVGSALY